MAAYDLSEGCSPITQTQTSLSAPSFHVTDFLLAGKKVALWQALFGASMQGVYPACCALLAAANGRAFPKASAV